MVGYSVILNHAALDKQAAIPMPVSAFHAPFFPFGMAEVYSILKGVRPQVSYGDVRSLSQIGGNSRQRFDAPRVVQE